MANRILNVDALSKGTKIEDVFKNSEIDVVVDLFSEGDTVFIAEKVDVKKTGFKYGIVGRGIVSAVEKIAGRGKLKLKLDNLVRNDIINLAYLKELDEPYWFQRYLRMPVELANDRIVSWLNETIDAGGVGVGGSVEVKPVEASQGAVEETGSKKEEAKAVSEPKKRATRKRTTTAKAKTATKSTGAKAGTKAGAKAGAQAKETSNVVEISSGKKSTAKAGTKSTTKKTASATKAGSTKTTARKTTRTRKSTRAVSGGTTQKRAARRGGTGAVLDRPESAVLKLDGSDEIVKLPMTKELQGVVDKFGEVVKSDVGTRIEVDMKGKDMQIVYHRVLNNDKESDRERFNFFVDEIVGSLMKMRGKLDWVSDSEKELLYAEEVEQVMELLKSDSDKATKVLNGLRKTKDEPDWALGLRLRDAVMDSLMDSKNVKTVFEVYGLTDIQKSGLEKLAKDLKLNVDLVLH